MGSTFESVVSPTDFEPFARVKSHLAQLLSGRRDTQDKYREIVDKVKLSD